MSHSLTLVIFSLYLLALCNADAGSSVSSIFASEMQQQYSNGVTGQWLREAHAKQHGCVRAYVTPLSGLPSNLAQGIFNVPEGTSYPAFIRFSNGFGRGFVPLSNPMSANQTDVIPDIRGMGLKLFNVSGNFNVPNMNTQCFTLTTDSVGFLDTDESATSFFTAVQSGKLSLAAWLATNPRLAILFAAQGTSGVIGDLLSTNWYQAVPQLHGTQSIGAKYHIYPCESERQRSPSKRNAKYTLGFDYLRDQLQEDLANSDVCLMWAVQFYSDPVSTPLNDSTASWNTPFYDIANITIFQQQFGTSDAQEAFCGAMSFNPASSIADHSPVGNTQAIRSRVYTDMAKLRRQLSGQSLSDATYQDWLNYPDM